MQTYACLEVMQEFRDLVTRDGRQVTGCTVGRS